MTLAWALSIVVFAFAMMATPGPNNVMLAATGANYGFRRALPQIAGIALGIVSVQVLLGLFGGTVLADPRVRGVLKWVGIAYLLYLAIRIATARPAVTTSGTSARPMTFTQAALFQWVNPKVWVAAGSSIVTFVAAAATSGVFAPAIGLAVIFGLVALPCSAGWAMIGVTTGRFIGSPKALRIFNVAMAMLLVASIAPMVFH